jgi:hypothetical protein
VTTELDIARHDGHAEIMPATPAPGTANAAMEMLRNHAEMMRMAYDLASAMVNTAMVPKTYQRKSKDDNSADNAAAAILYGLELGLNPIQSLQQIFPVHGQPSMYAKTMVALLKSKGYKFRTVESGPERVTVEGWWPGEDPEPSTWTIQRAIDAGFVPQTDPDTGKFKVNQYGKLIGNEKYLTQPEEMLWAKAASTVCRRLAPDVLLGIGHTVEDLESEPDLDPVRVKSERVQAAEILKQGDAPEAPKVRQWQASEAASKEGAKPEIAQVDDSAKASPAPAPELATSAEQRTLAAELERHGHKTAAAKRKWLSSDTGREITSAKELTGEEAASIIDRLCRREAGDMPILQSQWTAAERMLEQLGAGDAEKRLMFLRNFLPDRAALADPLELNEREAAKVLAELTQLLADEAAAEQLPVAPEGGE